MTGSFWTTS